MRKIARAKVRVPAFGKHFLSGRFAAFELPLGFRLSVRAKIGEDRMDSGADNGTRSPDCPVVQEKTAREALVPSNA